MKRLQIIIEERTLIPSHQFGFRQKHSTIEQVHRITNSIENALEDKMVCSGIFLDVAQAFDKVWHQGLKYKLQRDLPKQFYQILCSYIDDRYFRVKYEDEFSELKKIKAGVPQGSVLGPVLYLLYTRDIPNPIEATMATFADDTAILATGVNIEEATHKLQKAVNTIHDWTKMWRIKLNETKSVHVNFTNRRINIIRIKIDSQDVPYSDSVKYLGMTLDARLNWKEHIKKKRDELNYKYRKMYWLLGRSSELSTYNKLLLYRQVLKPVWTYGIQLWGCAKMTNVQIIQTFQNKVLRNIVNAPWYIRNDNLHRDLEIKLVSEEIRSCSVNYGQRIRQHENEEIQRMLSENEDDNNNNTRRLKRTRPLDLSN